jgi:hypothetical protein
MGAVPASPPENRRPVPNRFEEAAIPEPEVIPSPTPNPSQGAADMDTESAGQENGPSGQENGPAAQKAGAAEQTTGPAEPRRLAKPPSQSAWIFRPPPVSDVEAELASRRTGAARAALR